jgi:hypothetical protein
LTAAVSLLYSAPHENEKEGWSKGSEEDGRPEEARGEAHGIEEGASEARRAAVEPERDGRGEEATRHVHAFRRRGQGLGAISVSPAVAAFARRSIHPVRRRSRPREGEL